MEEKRSLYSKLHSIKAAWIKLQRDTKAFNYKYATLSQIQEKFWEALQEQWLLVVHFIKDNKVCTKICDTEWDMRQDHADMDYIQSEIEMSEWTKPQDKGSEITYYRRYNLLSLLDLEVEDDDGKKAQDSKPVEKSQDDDKPWIDDKIMKAISEKIKTTWEFPSIRDVRNNYKVSKANATKLEAMWVK